MKTTYNDFIGHIRNCYKKAFRYVGLFSCFINLLMLTVPIYMLQLFDRVLASQSHSTLLYLSLIAIFALLILSLLDMARNRVLVNLSSWFENITVPQALQRSPDELLAGKHYGARCLNDIQTVRGFFCSSSIFCFFDMPWTPIFMLVIFMLHPLLGFLTLIGALVLITLAIINEYATRNLVVDSSVNSLKAQAHINNTLQNSETIQSMGLMTKIIQKWSSTNKENLDSSVKASARNHFISSISKFVRLTLQISILATGAYLVIQSSITPGAMIAASILLARAYKPVESSITTWRSFLQARAAYRRLESFLAQPEKRKTNMPLPVPEGRISVENVTFFPPNSDTPTLKKVSFDIEPGEVVAVIGPSASGKTTLARLLCGAWKPTKGIVRLDGADIYSWNRDQVGQFIGYLPQNIGLFIATVRENIARMGEGTPELILAASKMVGIHELILKLSDGYETKLTDAGQQLSGGQRQRIALARAIYNDPKIVVLDEPGSNLDTAGHEALHKTIRALREKNCTVVLITHNQRHINLADKVLFLNDGNVKMYGPRDRIMSKVREIAASRPRIAAKASNSSPSKQATASRANSSSETNSAQTNKNSQYQANADTQPMEKTVNVKQTQAKATSNLDKPTQIKTKNEPTRGSLTTDDLHTNTAKSLDMLNDAHVNMAKAVAASTKLEVVPEPIAKIKEAETPRPTKKSVTLKKNNPLLKAIVKSNKAKIKARKLLKTKSLMLKSRLQLINANRIKHYLSASNISKMINLKPLQFSQANSHIATNANNLAELAKVSKHYNASKQYTPRNIDRSIAENASDSQSEKQPSNGLFARIKAKIAKITYTLKQKV